MNAFPATTDSYDGLRVTILGLGAFGGGVEAARFLAERGARVTVTDLKSESELSQSMERLRDIDLAATYFGGHPPDVFAKCDVVVVNPAVRPDANLLQQIHAEKIATTTEIELFLRECSATVVAVTGSNGKSTTANLIHHFIKYSGRRAHLGGNIGTSLLPVVDEIAADDIVVLELSSFQLNYLSGREFAPSHAVVTNLTPNHLDWHGDTMAYMKAKQVIFDHQSRSDFAYLPDSHETGTTSTLVDGIPIWRIRSQALRFGIGDFGENGVFADDGHLVFRSTTTEDAIRLQQPTTLPGQHNVQNLAAAAGVAWKVGMLPDEIAACLKSYQSLPHRLELVAKNSSLRFYNDSVSTTPESVVAALKTCGRPVVLIAGGADKGVSLAELAKEMAERASGVVLIGETALDLKTGIELAIGDCGGPEVHVADDMPTAFSQAVALAPPGGIVLLSPGCASFDWFRDFRERGDVFSNLARDWIAKQ